MGRPQQPRYRAASSTAPEETYSLDYLHAQEQSVSSEDAIKQFQISTTALYPNLIITLSPT